MNKGLLEKYCNNTCTNEELSSVIEWFDVSAITPEGKALLFKILEELPDEESNPEIDFDLILDKIHHKVDLAQSKKLLEEADQNLIKYKRKKRFLNILTRVAATLLLPVFGFGLYMSLKYQAVRHGQINVNQAYNEIYSSADAITKVTLPDGSNVWLNHSSTLKYPAIFRGEFRTVELSGEGYFEVVHNEKIPFIVKAGEVQVVAIGTTFNILAYPEEERVETSLINGCIELQQTEPDGKPLSLLKMKPTELATFQKLNSKISIRTIHDDRYFAWKDGKLVFNNEPMGEVVEKLKRWFNVDMQIADPKLLELTYTATFVNETLPQVLELIAMISPVNYSISHPQMVSPGTYTKRKVILNYRK
jgi:ferric-dicitrate binding protein FerR (iron transport regulator)